MIAYLLKSGFCLALVLFVYKVLLERERTYVFNRYYLLFGLCFSLVVPVVVMTTVIETPEIQDLSTVNFTNIDALRKSNENASSVEGIAIWQYSIVVLYALGSLFFVLRFSKNIYKIFVKITKNIHVLYKKASLVLLHENVLPHTFLHYIFLEKEAYDNATIADELYTHELAHVTQKHTLDIILIELIQIVFWFNPLLIYYKKAIQLNHEFLADDAVLRSNTQLPAYQQLLLDNASWSHELHLASNLNFSVTKKRLQMMTKQTSRVRAWLVATLTIPFFIGALFLFSTKVIAHEASSEIVEIPVTQTLVDNTKDPKEIYYKNATFIFEDEKGKKVEKTYTELTEKEKSMLIPPPQKPTLRRPNDKLLNDWKNKEQYAIWLDGKVVSNKDISNHTIVHYTKSFVHKNARSKRFPQLYQVQLYTEKGFQSIANEFGKPLDKGTVIHINLNNNQIRKIHRKTSQNSNEKLDKSVRHELAEINKLPVNYINKKNGPNEMILPVAKEVEQHKGRKDIVIKINKNGRFLVNYEHSCSFDELDKFIKQELKGILHKRARTALIIYDTAQKDSIESVKKVLAKNNISHISTIDASEIPPPPPPPPAPEKVKNTAWKNTKAVEIMRKITKGQQIKTMMINGEKHSYVIKNGRKYIFNKDSRLVNKKGELLPPPPPPPPAPKKHQIKEIKVPTPEKQSKNIEKFPEVVEIVETPEIVEVVEVSEETEMTPEIVEVVEESSEWKEVKSFLNPKDKTGSFTAEGETYYYAIQNKKISIYNRFGQKMNSNDKKFQEALSKLKE